MTNLSKLRRDHAGILTILAKFRHLIAKASPPPRLHLFALRHELSSLLVGHLKAEDWVLYPRLLADTDVTIAATAHAFCDEMGGLAAAYTQHCKQWTAESIAADWRGYCRESEALIDALANRILRENRELYPLVERLNRAA
ncbi:hemerythrin domain-containing protein [Sphingomonas sp.]|uniref:hemerythrin domain-containing protein n=1 Tax=Sphingomonas sp. TaxID=28214 RepID=UPI00286BD4B3|nr:hemerythrin domain-containing protein [Sphingomonas sp.]